MKLSLIRIAHTVPFLLQLVRHIPPRLFFSWVLFNVTFASLFNPHSKRVLRPFFAVLKGIYAPEALRKKARRYLLFIRLYKHLPRALATWEQRWPDWVVVEGEEHLKDALKPGRGVFLMSAHNYGFTALVCPVLAARGYVMNRGGNGHKPEKYVRRWGKHYRGNWTFLRYKGDYWHRLKLLKTIRERLSHNEIIHIAPRGRPMGEPQAELNFWYGKYFIDHLWLKVIEICQAPVLPCFAIADSDYRIRIKIYPPLEPETEIVAKGFGAILMEYLERSPEFGRVWKSIFYQRAGW